jgi:hypothetical protein
MHGNPVADVAVFAYVTSAMYEGLAFVSGYSSMDGRYMLRVHKGGTFYFMVMGEFGSLFPMSGMIISDNDKETPDGILVETGEIKKKVDIRMTMPLQR